MRSANSVGAALLATAVLALGGCGGGETVAGIDRGGTPGAVSVGAISGFGSVIVNGVVFSTITATIIVDGQVATQADLAVGQVVVVTGEIDANGTTGTADRIVFDDIVEGPIMAIDPAAGTMVVLGQAVRADENTSYDDDISPRSLNGLKLGDIVEISGFVDADGVALATRIELEAAGAEFELTGFIANVDTANFRFEIGGQVVDYSAAMLVNFPSGEPADGDLVEAKGNSVGAGGELLATRVERRQFELPGDDGDDVELEGLITRFVSAADFDVNGFPVTTTGSTSYEGGSASDLGLNVRVEVEGELNSADVLVADEVKFKPKGVVRIAAPVESISGSVVTLLEIPVRVTPVTRLEDKSDADREPFSVSDIAVGNYLHIRGFEDPAGSGQVTATLLERDDLETEVELRGLVDSVAQPNFTILGVTIATNAGTGFQDVNDMPIMPGAFFGSALGRIVDVKGVLNGGVIVAEEVGFED